MSEGEREMTINKTPSYLVTCACVVGQGAKLLSCSHVLESGEAPASANSRGHEAVHVCNVPSRFLSPEFPELLRA